MSPRNAAPLVVVGDALLDRDLEGRVERLSPEAPVPVVDDPVERARPGGAGLAAALAAADGERPVQLVTALADDEPADELRELLAAAGVEVVDVGLAGATPEKVRIRGGGRTLLRLDRGGRGEAEVGVRVRGLAEARKAISGAGGVLVSDYGRGVAGLGVMREAVRAMPPQSPLVWDPHPRGAEPVAGALLVTPNAAEAARFCPVAGRDGEGADAQRAAELARRWRAAYVCLTRGASGALMAGAEGPPLVVPASSAGEAADPCGAGDRFAARAAMLLAGGELPSAAVAGAVAAASEFVAAGGAARMGGFGAAPSPADGSVDRFGEQAALALSAR
ncbi:MAG: ADP-heptose synthase / D-glycero-beta-D-manno-heptose 7-phosphate kinase, partial [uncultured Solirubrobacterales bacterium]